MNRLTTGFACLAGMVMVGASFADLPRLISFQGRLDDGVGTSATLGVSFYGQASGGSPIFTEVHANVPLNEGLFTLLLGTQTINGIPKEVMAAGDVWVAVSVNGGSQSNPRIRLAMAPLAGRAAFADELAVPGTTTTAVGVDAFGNVDILDAEQRAKLSLRPGSGPFGAEMELRDQHGDTRAALNADRGELVLRNTSDPRDRVILGAGDGSSEFGPYLHLADTEGTLTFEVQSMESDTSGSQLFMRQDDGTLTVDLDAEYQANGGARLVLGNGAEFIMENSDDTERLTIDAEAGTFEMRNASDKVALTLNSNQSGGSGELRLRDPNGNSRASMTGFSGGGQLILEDASGRDSLRFYGESPFTGDHGGAIYFRNGSTTTMELHANYANSGESRMIIDVIEIVAGADLSERFDIRSNDEGKVAPGTVVSIDPAQPGRLVTSDAPYDRKVAGVVSGADGIKPGLLMGQAGSIADGEYPVALTGRVWCKVDAQFGAVRPGDLLTTSSNPGYAMRVSDSARANGAIIGKAMTELDSGTGLVLVLISLQ